MEINALNTNDLAPKVYRYLAESGISESSRNGPVLRAPEPVTVRLDHPWERMNLCPVRDANPFFHVWEAVAMLAGHNSVDLMAAFAARMATFSDDGERYNAFYGERARSTRGDQLMRAAKELAIRPDSRQAVVSLWDAQSDNLERPTKDRACNLSMLFFIREGCLCMTTFNRSNDAIWGGVSGANIVHLSYFQEWVACYLQIPMGRWWHISNNLHVYLDNPKWEGLKTAPTVYTYPNRLRPLLFQGAAEAVQFDTQARQLCRAAERLLAGDRIEGYGPHNPWLRTVALPLLHSWIAHKQKQPVLALRHADECADIACSEAAVEWLLRRVKQ